MKRINKISLETAVGAFMVFGLLCLSYLAIKLGDVSLLESDRLHLQAQFVSSSGLKEGAFVEVGGVRVGTVENIRVDYETYLSVVDLALDPNLRLQEDAIASIRTSGIIGDKFVKITPGGSETYIAPGGEIFETESSISIEELISKYIFESDNKK
jgi:phospholipid/cholesterol/gamma-HCH transport system substrate-binding protein